MTLLDRSLDRWDVRSHHEKTIEASASDTYAAVRGLDMGRSLPVLALVTIRALPRLLMGKTKARRAVTLDSFFEVGFVILEEEPGSELVLGAVGRFWRPDGGIVQVTPDEFAAFDRPGYAKGAINFRVDEESPSRTILTTETRVQCTDLGARKRFLLYWKLIGPFSGVIRQLALAEIKRTAEETVAP
jgi:hypothetical protein